MWVLESRWSDPHLVYVAVILPPMLFAPMVLEPDEGEVVIQRSMMRLTSFMMVHAPPDDGYDKTEWEVYATNDPNGEIVFSGVVDGEYFQVPLEIGSPAIRPIELYVPREGEILNNRSVFILSPVEFINQLDDTLDFMEFELYEGLPDDLVLVDSGTTTTSAFRLNNISSYGI